MDQETRNKLQRATQQIRRLLEAEFAEQLEGTFDILQNGQILPNPGKHLDARQRLTRQKLVDAIEHIRASAKSPKESVETYTREAAFTFLNRFVALRMLEARGLLQECVSKGDLSSGFKEFTGLAPGLSALPDGGYRLYLECLFDELSVEVKVLFDRRDTASLLWPRRAALNEVLDILGQADLAVIWREDETIGWVYQYFNSSEERKKMRDESSAPRNSRELAVRNQFFTPRYVVEFLTDNTLGRIWYEMRQGNTRLKEQCKYLVRRPSEVFVTEGEAPPPETDEQEDLSQEELLKKTVYIPHRPMKDPRELKVLDPACGSGHFLLYAFDLLTVIYEEAFEDSELGPALKRDYPSRDAFLNDVPRLILAHNLHGIDIDPRATQIASLALWMRAQRAYQEMKLPVRERPPVRKSNIVCAEPMPGDERMLKEFVDQLEPKVLGQLVEVVFDKMKLAGEAGSLLKIEEEIREAVTAARKQFMSKPLGVQQSLFAEMATPVRQQRFDLSGVNDAEFFDHAELLVLESLRNYAEKAETGQQLQRRLFTEDAARGFAFIDICRNRYDVVVMNPPFGEPTEKTRLSFKQLYPSSADNVAVSFMTRSEQFLHALGITSSITDCSWAKKYDYKEFRSGILKAANLRALVHLGWEVLDNANVETNLTVRGGQSNLAFAINVSNAIEKGTAICDAAINGPPQSFCRFLRFSQLPNSVFAFEMRDEEFDAYAKSDFVSESFMHAVAGVKSCDSTADFRLWWEVPQKQLGLLSDWQLLHNGSPYCPFHYPAFFAVRTDKGTWTQLMGNGGARPGEAYYPKPGIAFGKRTDAMYGYIKPSGQVFSQEGQAIFPKADVSIWAALALSNSSIFSRHANYVAGQHKYHNYLNKVCLPSVAIPHESHVAMEIHQQLRAMDQANENTHLLVCPTTRREFALGVPAESRIAEAEQQLQYVDDLRSANDTSISKSLQLSMDVRGHTKVDYYAHYFSESFSGRLVGCTWISYLLGIAFGRWDIRYATGEQAVPELPDPFAPLPVCPPGQLQNEHGLPAEPKDVPASYPVDIPWDGILVDDPNHPLDIMGRVHHVIEVIWKDKAADIEHEAAEILGVKALRDYFRKSGSGGFWPDHIKRYSKSRRKAPIYWQLATPSASYSVWLYYHRFTRDTFFKVREHVKEKLDHERRKLDRVRTEAGPQPSRSQQKDIEEQERFVAEIATLAEEVERIAPLWTPNLNDGVIINFAPLWRLVPHNKSWQKECKECWDSLVKGEYDWSHLAMHLWPERVVPKCVTDASLAIAHRLEDVFWRKDEKDRYQPKPEPDSGWRPVIEDLVKQRTSPAVKAALKSLLEAPVAATGTRTKRPRGKTAN